MRPSHAARNNLLSKHKTEFIEEFGECPKRNHKAWFTYNTPESGYKYFGVSTYGKPFEVFKAKDALEQIGLKSE